MKRVRSMVRLSYALVGVGGLAAMSLTSPPAAYAYSASVTSTAVAGGFVNAIAVSADGTASVVGTDTAGVAYSDTTSASLGDSWKPSSSGFGNDTPIGVDDIARRLSIASVAYMPTTPAQYVYALSGKDGSDVSSPKPGYLFVSSNKGLSWSHLILRDNASNPVSFNVEGGNINGGSGGNTHPRLTGHLIDFNKGYVTSSVYFGALDKIVRFQRGSEATTSTSLFDLTAATTISDYDYSGHGQSVSLFTSNGGNGHDTAWALLRDSRTDSDLERSSGGDNGLLKIAQAEGTGTYGYSWLQPDCLMEGKTNTDPGVLKSRPDEMVQVMEGGIATVYVSWGPAGIFRYKNFSGAAQWDLVARARSTPSDCLPGGGATVRNIDAAAAEFAWPSIDAVTDPSTSKTRLVIGGAPCPSSTTCGVPARTSYDSVQEVIVPWGSAGSAVSTTGTSLIISTPSDTLPSGTKWWHDAVFSGDPSAVSGNVAINARIDKQTYVAAQVKILNVSSAGYTVLVAGRGGVWRGQVTASGISLATAATWLPAGEGLSNLTSLRVDAYAGGQNKVISGDADWQLIRSNDRFSATAPHNHQIRSGQYDGDPKVGAITFNDVGGAFAAYSDPYNASTSTGGASVWYNPDPFSSTAPANCWIALGRPSSPNPVIGLGAGPHPTTANTTRVFAAVQSTGSGSHLWYADVANSPGSCASLAPTWTQVSSGSFGLTATDRVSILYSWSSTNKVVWIFDQEDGLFRMDNSTATPGSIKTLYATKLGTDAVGRYSGWLAAGGATNPHKASTLYFNFEQTAYKIDGNCAVPCSAPTALSGATFSFTDYAGITTEPDGSVVVATGVSDRDSITYPARLWKASTPGGASLSLALPATSGSNYDEYTVLGWHNEQLVADPTTGSTTVYAANSLGGLVVASP